MMIAVTGCGENSFGKDDFFGTWVADYEGTYNGEKDYVTTTMVFDGKSENLFNGGDGLFCQSKVAYSAVNAADSETGAVTGKTPRLVNFYWGSYTLKDNSNYTAGNIILTYMAGITLYSKKSSIGTLTDNDVATASVKLGEGTYDLNDLMEITFGKGTTTTDENGNEVYTGLDKANAIDKPTKDYETGKDFFDAHIDEMSERNYYIAVGGITEEEAALRGDIEAFTFSLSSGNLFDGYRAINMREWYWEDQIRFSYDKSSQTWTFAKINDFDTAAANFNANGYVDATDSGRTTRWYQPNLKGTQRGTAKNKYLQATAASDGIAIGDIVYKNQKVDYIKGSTKTWSKNYASAGKGSWDVGERAFARVRETKNKKLDINAALKFIKGEIADLDGNYINYVANEIGADAEEPDDSLNYDDDSSEGAWRSAAEEDTAYASAELIKLVGERMEK